MARHRFPGRPGVKFDRLGVHYAIDEPLRGLDPTTRLIANIDRGLRNFRELFGDSDEEDFCGFTKRDVAQATKKLENIKNEERKLLEGERPKRLSSRPETPKKTFARIVKTGTVRQTRSHLDRSVEEIKKQVAAEDVKIKKKQVAPPTPKTPPDKKREEPKKKFGGFKFGSLRIKFSGDAGSLVRDKEQPKKDSTPKGKVKPVKDDKSTGKKGRGKERVNVGRTKSVEKESPKGKDKESPKGKEKESPKEKKKESPKEKKKRRSEEEVPVKRGPGRPKKAQAVIPRKQVSTKLARVKQLLSQAKRGRKGAKGKGQAVSERPSSRGSRRSSKDSSPGKPSPRRRSSSGPKVTPPAKPKQFVLPAVSSRSSRIIIPNKRFLDEEYTGVVAKKTKSDIVSPSKKEFETESPTVTQASAPLPAATAGSSAFGLLDSCHNQKVAPAFGQPGSQALPARPPPGYAYVPVPVEPSGESQGTGSGKSLLEQPLIVEGKRQRKPSMKMMMKLTDTEEVLLEGGDDDETDDQQETKPETEGAAKLASGDAAKLSGQNILRKAKLQLNQAALNRSKAALARSLKYKMKKEEARLKKEGDKQKGTTPFSSSFAGLGSMPVVPLSPIKLTAMGSPPALGMTQASSHSLQAGVLAFSPEGAKSEKDIETREGEVQDPVQRRKQAALARKEKAALNRELRRKNMVKQLPDKKCALCNDRTSKFYNRYYGVPSCQSCSRFYRLKTMERVQSGKRFVCAKYGKCKLPLSIGRKNMCIACRYAKCEKYLPQPQFLKDLKSPLSEVDPKMRKKKKVPTATLR